MIDQKTAQYLENQLRGRREEILAFRESLLSSREIQQERENEIEEMAGKGAILEGVDRLDDRAVDELRQIEDALANIQSGQYGRCLLCKRPIATRRLQAIPWASVCKRCAHQRETGFVSEIIEDDETDVQISDGHLVEALWDALDAKDNLNLSDLRIDSNGGTIQLTGSVPTEKEHQQILEVIEEDLGYEDVIDRLGIEERGQRRYDADDDNDAYEKEMAMQGEVAEDDPYAAMEEGVSVIPPDMMVVEDIR